MTFPLSFGSMNVSKGMIDVLLSSVAKLSSRHMINGVSVERIDGKLYLIGTDTHRMQVISLDNPGEDCRIVLRVKAFKDRVSKGARGFSIIDLDNISEAETIDGSFPRWECIVSAGRRDCQESEKRVSLGINDFGGVTFSGAYAIQPCFLVDLVKGFSQCTGYAKDSNSPVFFEVIDNGITFSHIIMPIRIP